MALPVLAKALVTRAFAERMGLVYLDTGAMYRSVTWLVQQNGVDPQDAASIAPLLNDLDLQLQSLPGGGQQVLVNGQDVSDAIRSPEVTASVSAVAAHRCVRQALTAQQKAMGAKGGLVAEGRDIGHRCFPGCGSEGVPHGHGGRTGPAPGSGSGPTGLPGA